MIRKNLVSMTTIFALIFGGGLLGCDQLGGEAQLIITAAHVHTAPASLDDPVWEKTPAMLVPVKGRDILGGEEATVFTKAVYNDDSLYFLFRWVDPTRSVIKQSWHFDGEQWVHLKGNEDRIALLFEITRINKFATKGCAVTCHSPPDVDREQWKLATKTAAERGDLWHWKAARSDPYNYADDAWLTVGGRPSGSYRETGRVKDRGEGGDIKNQTEDKSRPLYMQNPSKEPSVPGFLLLEEAVKITDYSIFKAGDIIPFRLPKKPSGSRFDVKALSRHANGAWTVMLSRKLDTGNDDDVVFNPRKRYSFAMAVFDDSGADHSKATKPLILVFKR
jgi:hypothetical protein